MTSLSVWSARIGQLQPFTNGGFRAPPECAGISRVDFLAAALTALRPTSMSL